jgi:hypothetical protein
LRTFLSVACESFLKFCPIHFHFLPLIYWIIGFSFAICRNITN